METACYGVRVVTAFLVGCIRIKGLEVVLTVWFKNYKFAFPPSTTLRNNILDRLCVYCVGFGYCNLWLDMILFCNSLWELVLSGGLVLTSVGTSSLGISCN